MFASGSKRTRLSPLLRLLRGIALLFLLSDSVGIAWAQPASDDAKSCASQDPNIVVPSCSALISSGQLNVSNKAIAYFNRGLAYLRQKNLDRAIADFDQAITLNPTLAEAYGNRGNAYFEKDEIGRAVADFSQVIFFAPKDLGGYSNRCRAYLRMGNVNDAIADCSRAIEINPGYAPAYVSRADAYETRGERDQAIVDLGKAIALDPQSPGAFFFRGRLLFFNGDLPNAIDDLRRTSELAPKSAYPALWYEIARRRSGLASGLSDAAARIDMASWPSPIIRLYLGQNTSDSALKAAEDANPSVQKEQLCEANFYVGEWMLQQGRKDEAARLLRLAKSGCGKNFIEYSAATAEVRSIEIDRRR